MAEKTHAESIPKRLSLFRLVVDQARIDEHVLAHQYEGSGTSDDPYVVTWIPNDAGNPFNWSSGLRWALTMVAAAECFAVAFSSSAYSGTIRELVLRLHASSELVTAGISLFVLGFAVGPLIWAPLSEVYGRQIIFLVTFAAFTAFCTGCTGASNIATLLVLRFFAGAFGSSPLTNAGGVIADIFPASERGLAMGIFSLAPAMGPTLGPFISGFLGESKGWKWVMGLMAIFAGVLWIIGSLCVPETYAPVLLRQRAKAMSKKTGKVYKTKVDIEKGEISLANTLKTALVRPWILLFMEPIVLILSIYMSIIYGTLYLLFGAYPIVFQETRGWSEGVGGLAFLGVAVGMVAATVFNNVLNKWYKQAAGKNGGIAPAEARLQGAMIGSIAIPVSMFWFAWTNYPSIHWISPVAAGAPFGFGLTLVFLAIINYLIDAYTIFAASVLAANTVLRSLFGAAFPLFTLKMYDNLGIHWASSIPAFLSLACLPFPFLLYKYGSAIRARCVYASEAEKAMQQLRVKATMQQDQPESDARLSSVVTRDTAETATSDEEKGEPQFEPLKTTRSRARAGSDPHTLVRTTSRAESLAEAAAYEASPYDIDRVNTNASVAGVDLKRVKTNKSLADR